MVVGEVFRAWTPVVAELLLRCSVAEPVEVFIHRFCPFGLDVVGDNLVSGGVVSLHWSFGLRVPHFMERLSHWHRLASIDKHNTDFGFTRGRHNISDDFGDSMHHAVVGGEFMVARHEEMASRSAACL